MHVGLIVRDESERSVKNQVSKVELVDFTTGWQVACENLQMLAHKKIIIITKQKNKKHKQKQKQKAKRKKKKKTERKEN